MSTGMLWHLEWVAPNPLLHATPTCPLRRRVAGAGI